MEIKIQIEKASAHSSPVLSFLVFSLNLLCFLVSQSLPHSFNIASAHTRSPSSSTLHYCSANQRIRVIQGAPVNQRQGLLKRQLQTDTRRSVYTRKRLHKALDTDLKHRSGTQAAEVILITSVQVVQCNSRVCFHAVLIPIRNKTAKVSHVLVSTFKIMLSFCITLVILTDNKSLFINSVQQSKSI